MAKNNALDMIAWILLIAGALNWGLVGLFDFNLVQSLLGFVSWLPDVVYVAVGASGLYGVYMAITKK